MRLYSSAVDKFEKVLALKPDNVSVMVTCGLALKDMALCMSLDDPDTLINLEVILRGCYLLRGGGIEKRTLCCLHDADQHFVVCCWTGMGEQQVLL